MTKRRGLGKGLDALLGVHTKTEVPTLATAPATPETGDNPGTGLKYLPIEFLRRGQYQPRKDIDPETLTELAQSIKSQGLMQPLLVRPLQKGHYEIIAGERRWRACQQAGLDSVPCLIKSINDEAALAMALIENMQREDLNPMEEAMGLKRLQDEFQLTHQEIAQAVGKSRTGITNLLRLNNLQDEVKTLLEHGDLEMGHARALLTLPDTLQVEAARKVVAQGLSVRQAEALARELILDKPKPKNAQSLDPNVRKLQDNLSEKLGAAVKIEHKASGKGRLVVHYTTLDELEGILAHIN